MTEQQQQLNRVVPKLKDVIVEACFIRYYYTNRMNGKTAVIKLREIQEYVSLKITNVVSDSVSRVLRELRKQGVIDYEVIDRKNSLYWIKGVNA